MTQEREKHKGGVKQQQGKGGHSKAIGLRDQRKAAAARARQKDENRSEFIRREKRKRQLLQKTSQHIPSELKLHHVYGYNGRLPHNLGLTTGGSQVCFAAAGVLVNLNTQAYLQLFIPVSPSPIYLCNPLGRTWSRRWERSTRRTSGTNLPPPSFSL